MESELRADSNLLQRVIAAIREESKAVTIAQVSMIISIVFSVLAIMAMYDATQANATAETWQTMYKETERECRLAQMEIDDFKMMLSKAGISTEHIGEKP